MLRRVKGARLSRPAALLLLIGVIAATMAIIPAAAGGGVNGGPVYTFSAGASCAVGGPIITVDVSCTDGSELKCPTPGRIAWWWIKNDPEPPGTGPGPLHEIVRGSFPGTLSAQVGPPWPAEAAGHRIEVFAQRCTAWSSGTCTSFRDGYIGGAKLSEPDCPNIVVHKLTDPSATGQSFEFNPSWSETNFYLKDGESHDSGPLPTGPHSIAEIVPAGWRLDDAWCVFSTEITQGGDGFSEVRVRRGFPPDQIELSEGQTVHCYFANEQLGRIIVKKVVSPADAPAGSFGFDASFGDFLLAGGASHDSGLIAAGIYSVAEVGLPAGWSLASAFCDDGSSLAAIGVSPGETVTCTFNDRYEETEETTTTTTTTTTVPPSTTTTTEAEGPGELPYTGGQPWTLTLLLGGLAAVLMGLSLRVWSLMRQTDKL